MPDRESFRWFKSTFHTEIERALAGTPFSLDMVAAIAAQETGHIWGPLHDKLPLDTLLDICVGDTLDGGRGRTAFPRSKDDLMAAPRGDEMFAIAREALGAMSEHVPGFDGVAKRPDKFCHGFGIFQYDLQFFRTDPDYFLNREWRRFESSLMKAIEELLDAMDRMGIGGHRSLSDTERVHVAIAYNAGTFKPTKGLQQGFFDGKKFYGEMIFDFLRLSQTVSVPGQPAAIPPPAPGRAPLAPPTPVGATAPLFEVHVHESPLLLRSEPRIVRAHPHANVIARLPDGQRVRLVSGTRDDTFVEVETSLNGAHLRGFAASNFLVPAPATADVPAAAPAVAPPDTGVVAVLAPTRPGVVTKRTAPATPQSLNEPDQPGRHGTTPDRLRAELNAIVDYLAVDRPSHTRYQRRAGRTFGNVYAHDYCHLAGAYLPRVWWTPDAIERLARGETVEPHLGSTIDEQRTNDLFQWLRAFGLRFGWRQTGTPTKLQTEANAGAIGLIVARSNGEGRPGQIAIVVPETADARARRNSNGDVIAPLQSQAGVANVRRDTGRLNWWTQDQFADSAFWVHA